MIATVSFQAIGFTLFVHWYYMLLGKLSEIMLRLFSGFEGVIFFYYVVNVLSFFS